MNEKMDTLDALLYRLPSSSPPQGLAERICLAVRARKAAAQPLFFWTGRHTRRAAWMLGLLGLVLLVAFAWEAGVQLPSTDGVSSWFGDALSAPQTILDGLSTWWSGISTIGATVLPLALAFLTLATFLQVSSLLSEWTGVPSDGPKIA